MRLSKVPQGPTATYRIEKYSLISDVVNSQTNPRPPGNEYSHPPLMVLNNFSADKSKHSTLITTLWQSVFPSINIQKIHLHHCKRVVLLDYNPETENISMRHYLITVVAKGINKPIKKLINRKNELPNLQNYEDISTYVSKFFFSILSLLFASFIHDFDLVTWEEVRVMLKMVLMLKSQDKMVLCKWLFVYTN